ncbi:hypothetical protein [Amycolatopsis sp. NPDC049868]|uniref:hypothetical protein n=1 Tax=Amycolatopsis sp. NPDC049868 TaxID=3363934 RepID=UPI0037B6F7BA
MIFTVALLGGFSAGCTESPTATSTATASSSSTTSSTTPALPTSTSKSSPSPTTSTPPSEYPKFVPKSKVDKRYTQYVDGDKMVMLAPGVYAEPSPDGVLGTLEDYSSYLGNCTAIKRYSETHPGGHTCW